MRHLKSSAHIQDMQCKLTQQQLEKLSEKVFPSVESLLLEEKIPPGSSLATSLSAVYIPLAYALAREHACKHRGSTLIVGINGAQGAGKSTLAKILEKILEQGFNKTGVSFSIDDLYKKKAQRKLLAQSIHPLLSTRGVPGTHDIALGLSIFRQLQNNQHWQCLIPVFNKATDERMPESQWQHVSGHCDIILFEGWCVGSVAQSTEQLKTPINALEHEQDSDGQWREYVNSQLEGPYAELFSLIDILVMLEIPDFSKVPEWRKLQESKLRDSIGDRQNSVKATMSDTEIDDFIMHFERITRHTLKEMPARCDILLPLDNAHQIKGIIKRR